MGGIGNQLFQYALGYTLKEKFNRQIQFDISHYNLDNQAGYTFRELTIKVFNINSFNENISSKPCINNNIFSKAIRFIERTFLPYYKNSYIEEKRFEFDLNVFKVRDNTCLVGYWQSPKYFEGLEEKLRSQLILNKELSDKAIVVSKLIKSYNNSVSIHIRRGDYLTKYKHIYCHQKKTYYIDGVNYISTKLKTEDITLFVFSDDIEWCIKNVNYSHKTIFVDSKDMYTYEDMILMSECEHNIIANSSYSWWSAWLNANPTKIVVCPKNWFADNKLNNSFVKDIFPASWITL